MSGVLCAASVIGAAPAALPSLSGTITWIGSSPEIVSSVAGTTAGHFHCGGSGGGGGPYTFVLYWTGTHLNVAFTDSSSGESTVNWSGLNVGNVGSGNASAIMTDTASGMQIDLYNELGQFAGMSVRRDS